jgi:hypothetical protein
MILNFLQTRDPPIIPSLHKEPHRLTPDCEFADLLSKVKGFGSENKESLGQLLFHFFRCYGYEIDYEKSVVSVREGRLLTRNEKNWHLAGSVLRNHSTLNAIWVTLLMTLHGVAFIWKSGALLTCLQTEAN